VNSVAGMWTSMSQELVTDCRAKIHVSSLHSAWVRLDCENLLLCRFLPMAGSLSWSPTHDASVLHPKAMGRLALDVLLQHPSPTTVVSVAKSDIDGILSMPKCSDTNHEQS
jgi:hypothetical protein